MFQLLVQENLSAENLTLTNRARQGFNEQ